MSHETNNLLQSTPASPLIAARPTHSAVTSTLLTLALIALGSSSVFAQVEYPFTVPEPITATLHVDTNTQRPAQPMLLGLNCNWPEGLYGKIGYDHPDAQKLIRTLHPSSLRFPHGVWSNFYDWETDGRRITDDYQTLYDAAVKDHPDLTYGFPGFDQLHDELGFDVLYTWNVNYDSPEKGARRLRDLIDKGFEVRWIELGNEIFWKTQRSEATKDIDRYIAVSKAHTQAIKAIAPNVQVSVPVQWRNAAADPWNQALARQNYYDAVTLHKYMGYPETAEGAAEALDAKQTMIETGESLRRIYPNKSIWVSEWSVSCGDNAISVLAMADVCLGLLQHPDLFAIADYFQINASERLITYDKKTRTHSRTGYGAAFEVVRSVFENSDIYATRIESTPIGDGLESVAATAVNHDGNTIIFAINKTPSDALLQVRIDDKDADTPYTHQTFAFKHINESKSFSMDQNILQPIEPTSPGIRLPPLSINRIELTN